MTYENIRIIRDDLVPLLADNTEILDRTVALCQKNCPIDVLLWELEDLSGLRNLTWDEVKQFISDSMNAGLMVGIDLSGDTMPTAISRAAAPSGIGCAGGNVWVTPPGETYSLRFYRNGEYKLSMENYYITSLESLDAVSGDVVQICRVVGGVVGWWARIAVP